VDASDHRATGELLVDHFSSRYLIYRLTGVICFQAAPILAGVLLLIGLPSSGCTAAVVATTIVVMVASLPGMRVSPSYRIYERGFQPYLKPYRSAFWSFFVPFGEVDELRIEKSHGILRRTSLLVRRKNGVVHATPLAHLEEDEALFLAELLAKENPAARIRLGPLAGSAGAEGSTPSGGSLRRSDRGQGRTSTPGR